MSLARRGRFHFQRVSVGNRRLVRGLLKRDLRPLDFHSGIRHGLAGLGHDGCDKLRPTDPDSLRHATEQSHTFRRGNFAGGGKSPVGTCNRALNLGRIGEANFGNQFPVPRIDHSLDGGRGFPTAIEIKGFYHRRSTSRFSIKMGRPSRVKLFMSSSGSSASGIITPRSGIFPVTSSLAVTAGGMPVCTKVSE